MRRALVFGLVFLFGGVTAGVLSAQPAAPPAAAEPERAAAREARLRGMLSGVKLVGRFTIDAPPGTPVPGEKEMPREEEYTITTVTKLADGDWWTMLARMRFGTVDLTLPVPVEVKWAGDTPVITLDKVTVPGLGTFSARVVLDGERYAGTWQHDAIGGHMFGRIVAAAADAAGAAQDPAATKPAEPAKP